MNEQQKNPDLSDCFDDFFKRRPKTAYFILISLFFLMIAGIIYDKKQSAQKDGDAFRRYLKFRYRTIQTLVDTYSQMHLDLAVLDGYEKSKQILGDIDPDKDAHFSSLNKLYYAAAHLFLKSTYVTIIIRSAVDSDAMVALDKDNLPPNTYVSPDIQNAPILMPKLLLERDQRLRDLDSHSQRSDSLARNGDLANLMLNTATLQQDFLDALFFYISVNDLLPEEGVGELADRDRQVNYQALFNDTTYSVVGRYQAMTIFQEKVLLNTLSSMYIIYCRASSMEPERDFVLNAADQMDKALYVNRRTNYNEVFKKLAKSSRIIDTMASHTVSALKDVLEFAGN